VAVVRALLTPRWIAVHLGVLVIVAGFLGLGWWQVTRARGGNALSYGYAVEWPVFAAFVVWVWIVEMRKVLRAGPASDDVDRGRSVVVDDQTTTPSPRSTEKEQRRRARSAAAYDDSDDPALAAYNHYLSWLNAHPHATAADYPGMPAPATKESS
jgi:hypothetical protein